MSAGTATAVSEVETFQARPESPFRLALRRLRRDKAAPRLGRVRMLEVMEEPYIRTAAAKGASRTRSSAAMRCGTRWGPVLTLVGMDVGLALGIALHFESVYRLPGLGLTTLGALNGQVGFALPMILGIVLVIGVVIIAVNFAIDLAVAWMDPRAAQAGTRRATVGRIA